MTLDVEAAAAALDALAREAGIRAGKGLSAGQRAALGLLRVANAHMERALRVISVERGHDPKDFALVSFGGAGGLHAVSLARSLGVRQVVVPPEASTLSALGMLIAPVVKDYVQTVMRAGEVALEELEHSVAPLAERGIQEVRSEGVEPGDITVHPELDLRYRGQSFEITIPLAPDYRRRFDATHESLYGHADPAAPIEIVNLRLRAVGAVPGLPSQEPAVLEGESAPGMVDRREVVVGEGGPVPDVPLYSSERLFPGQTFRGPAIVVRRDTTIYVDPEGEAEVDALCNLLVKPS